MTLINTDDIVTLLKNDAWRMGILRTVAALNLPDWAIGAGFVRACVWDALCGKPSRTPLPDIDVIYFDPHDTARARDAEHEAALRAQGPDIAWSVKNQARMHERNNDTPYADTADALAHWLETPTCIAVSLDQAGAITIMAPHGITDLLALRVRPTPAAQIKMDQYRARMQDKDWPAHWPELKIEEL